MLGRKSLVILDKMPSTDQTTHLIMVWFAILWSNIISAIEFRRKSGEIFSMTLFALGIFITVTKQSKSPLSRNRVLPEDKSWFLSLANPTAAKGRCIVGNLPNRVPDLPEFHSIGLQSDNLPVEKLARSALLDANLSEKLNQLGICCKISTSQSFTWWPLSLVAEVGAVGGKRHLSQLEGGAYWVWDTALTHSFTTTHGRRPTLCTPVQSGGGAPVQHQLVLLLNY